MTRLGSLKGTNSSNGKDGNHMRQEENGGSTSCTVHGLCSCSRAVENADECSHLPVEDGPLPACGGLPNGSVRSSNGATLSNLYEQNLFDDSEDDENDGDWEPIQNFAVKKWSCLNCTSPNFGDASQCIFCGENSDFEVRGYDAFQAQIEQLSRENLQSALSSSTAIAFDERMLLHYEIEMKMQPHPERPDRVRAIAAGLVNAGIFPSNCSLIPSREITKEELLMVHTSDHIDTVELTEKFFCCYFTSDTYANRDSACAARLAAGSCADLATSILSGRVRNGFALVRPPGHHAGVKQAMGFCLHNNAAVAAIAAQQAGAKKVLIVDWDVHHGNGTQEIFDGNKSVLYISLHRHQDGSFYPGTGAALEVGDKDGKGFSVNIPWSCGGVGDNDYIYAFQHVVCPIALEFSPDITIISAGFDAARGDPLGGCDVTPAGYSQMTHMLNSCSGGKLLAILEGGYNLRSISSSATAVVKVLLGNNPNYDLSTPVPTKAGVKTVLQVLEIQQHFWPTLAPTYALLHLHWRSLLSKNGSSLKRNHRSPLWWKKWGRGRFLFEVLRRRSLSRSLRRERISGLLGAMPSEKDEA